MKTYRCSRGCCVIKAWTYVPGKPGPSYRHREPGKVIKAGVILCTLNDETLLVRSSGKVWGFPKGHIEPNETSKACALRELHEETGITLPPSLLDQIEPIRIYNTDYYVVKVPSKLPINIKTISSIKHNDSSGIGWISIYCLTHGNLRCTCALKKYFCFKEKT